MKVLYIFFWNRWPPLGEV